jgi:hypothetical protein
VKKMLKTKSQKPGSQPQQSLPFDLGSLESQIGSHKKPFGVQSWIELLGWD